MAQLTQAQLIQKCIEDYRRQLPLFQKMENYYKGDTDAMVGYQIIKSRANNKVPNNFIKKFIKEEVSYAVGNKITYISRSSNEDIIQQITDNTAHWSELHDQNVMKNMLKFGFCYELYYLDEGKFSARVLTPLNAYGLFDENNNPVLFIHFFYKKFDDKEYMDLYLQDKIVHYADNVIIGETLNNINWGGIPVSLCSISEEMEHDTLYKDLKGLQDAFEINLSDISSEISDFRNAYLVLLGCDMEDEELVKAKLQGAFKLPNGDKIDVKWLIKNINDSFVQNTLSTIKENIYELSSHINSNEKLQSNTSSLALRTRLISLEQRVKLNCGAMADCIKNRLKFLFKYISVKSGKQFDYTDIKVKFTMMIPQDDLMTAQILSQAGDKISTRTGIAQFSFIDNVDEEMKRIEAEREMIDLDRVDVNE